MAEDDAGAGAALDDEEEPPPDEQPVRASAPTAAMDAVVMSALRVIMAAP